ncbi:MAG: 2-oxo acid dehydrogenase subunit E2 [Bacteroidetes bacterium]|nr:2-oxo acid dehydrogenase subunit E2 [Bacteroidota bacterium]
MALLREILVPLLAVNDTTLTVQELTRNNGTAVAASDVILILETSKTTFDVEAGVDGFVQYLCEAGRDYEVNELIARIYTEVSETELKEKTDLKNGAVDLPMGADQRLTAWQGESVFSFRALELLGQYNLSKQLFNGIDFIDSIQVLKRAGVWTDIASNNSVNSEQAQVKENLPPIPFVRKKISRSKRTEIENLGHIQQWGLTSTINTSIDTTGLYQSLNSSLRVIKNSLLPIIIYEVGRLLMKYRPLNAFFEDGYLHEYEVINLGFAVDIDKGLKVLAIKSADRLDIKEIENQIISLSEKYIEDRIEVDDMSDITFTITDLSGEGVDFFKPLINKRNSSILGISSRDHKLERVVLSLTFDHRATEGKYVSQFLGMLKERIESYRADFSLVKRDVRCYKCSNSMADDLCAMAFMKCLTPSGHDGFICQSCLNGF